MWAANCPQWLRRCARCRCLPWVRQSRGRLLVFVDPSSAEAQERQELAEMMLQPDAVASNTAGLPNPPGVAVIQPAVTLVVNNPDQATPVRASPGMRRLHQAADQALVTAVEAAQYVELPGLPGAYTSVEAAFLMSLLPHEPWSFRHIRDEDNGEGDAECRVCLADYEPGDDIVRLPCLHYAHTRCMEEWLVRSPRCPVCRTSVRDTLQGDFT